MKSVPSPSVPFVDLKVSRDQVDVINLLLLKTFEASLRKQLTSGEFDASLIAAAVQWCSNQGSGVSEHTEALAGVAARFSTKDGGSLEDLIDSIAPRTPPSDAFVRGL